MTYQNDNIMTTIQALAFAAKVQIGTKIAGGAQVLIVTRITDTTIYGNSEYCLKKFNKEQEIGLAFTTLLNPHYNKNIKIID